MDEFPFGGIGHHQDYPRVGEGAGVEILFHGETGTQETGAPQACLSYGVAGRTDDAQERNGGTGGNFTENVMGCVGGHEGKIGPGSGQGPCRPGKEVYHLFGPVPGDEIQHACHVNAVYKDLRVVGAAGAFPVCADNGTVVVNCRFGAYTADHAGSLHAVSFPARIYLKYFQSHTKRNLIPLYRPQKTQPRGPGLTFFCR